MAQVFSLLVETRLILSTDHTNKLSKQKTYARILSPFPKPSKQAHSRNLSEQQRKYHESIASSIISNS